MAGPFRLSPRVQSCQDTTKITTWPGINLAVLQLFFNDSRVASDMADHAYSSQLAYEIPPLHIIGTHNFSNFLERDRKIAANLNVITSHMKSGETVFRDALGEALLHTPPVESSSHWSIPHILSYASFALSLLLSLALFITYQKLRTIITLTTIAIPAVRSDLYPRSPGMTPVVLPFPMLFNLPFNLTF